MIDRLQVIYYMGNIAKQIDDIQESMKDPTSKPPITLGLLSQLSPSELIKFHWNRITVLERCLAIPESKTRQEMTDLKNACCLSCQRGIDNLLPGNTQFPCVNDFQKVTDYKLRETCFIRGLT